MIGKQVIGRSFADALDYVEGKKGTTWIGGNMAGETRCELVEEFRTSETLNSRVQRTVYHVSLSTLPEEEMDDRMWCKIARRYLSDMGFQECQYLIYRHTDTEHPHVHILAARVRITDGTVVSDSWNFLRSEKVLRAIERDFGLCQTVSSRELKRNSPKTGEIRMMRRMGKKSVRLELQGKVARAVAISRSVDEVVAKLATEGVEMRLRRDRQGAILGASFALNGVAFQGRQLGEDYSWSTLEGHIRSALREDSASLPSEWFPQIAVTRNNESERRDKQDTGVKEKRRELRMKYVQLRNYARERVAGIERDRKLQDVAVAILALRDCEDVAQTRAVLSQSDTIRELSGAMSKEKYSKEAIRYIEGVTAEAVKATWQYRHDSQMELSY